jgi:tetratricopeptide (TPR) repeat protein
MLVVGGALLATLLAFRRWPWAGFLGIWCFAILAASSSVVPIATQIAAEHRMYLALAAVVALAVVSLDRCIDLVIPDRWHQAIWSLSLAAASILILGFTTYHRNKVYHTALGLWADVVEKVPTNYAAWDNLGYSYRLMGDLERALEALNRGISIRGDYANLYDERARTYEAMHKLPEAVQDYNRAIELAPDLLRSRSRRAMLFLRLKRYTEAEDAFNTLLETQDDMNGNLHFLRAQARMLLGRFEAARSDLETVLARNPGARRQVEQMLNILHKRHRQHKTEGGTDKG